VTRRRLPAALGVLAGGRMLLVDATNAFAEQIHLLWQHQSARRRGEAGYAPPETVVLTHAHTGHYVGLWQLDRSVLAARGVRVLGPPRTIALLADQEPWAWMVRDGYITLSPMDSDVPYELVPGVRVTALLVPHRAEWGTDTIGLRIEGPRRAALYVPDIDSWDAWERDIADVVAGVDLALLDGCFWEPFHIPGVPHPPIRDTLDRLQSLADGGRTRIVFTHLNHSNPVSDPASSEAAEVRQRGFEVAVEGHVFDL
jgi:pyrroloquinoline quinone biosynthesis protein B